MAKPRFEPLHGRQVTREREWADLHAFEAHYQPHTRLEDHEHSKPFLTYVLRGSYVERGSAMSRQCTSGDVIVHAPGEAHSNDVGGAGTASLNVEITPELWDDFLLEAGGKHVTTRVHSGDVQWTAIDVWREFHTRDCATPLAMMESVALLCAELRRDRTPLRRGSSRRIDEAADYLAERGLDVPHLADVADHVHTHPMHLAKLFRQRYGYSMGEFVRRRRVAWACSELANCHRTITSIAVEAGFADHAHFTRTFRRLTGCTPSWYRAHLP